MTTTMHEISPSPFTAKINFSPNSLYQGKHAIWTFPSNLYAPKNATAEQHFRAIEKLVLQTYLGSFEVASVFDNRPKAEIKYDVFFEKLNPLVLQVYHNNVYIDKRRQLDLTWLTPTIDIEWQERAVRRFNRENLINQIDDFKNRLQREIKRYKRKSKL